MSSTATEPPASTSYTPAPELSSGLSQKKVTYDLARLIAGAKELKTSEFGSAMISHM
jgi:isocitrate dehydrogenase